MSEILSQSEIDELLGALMAGDSDSAAGSSDNDNAKKVKEYDFRTANRFPKEQMRTFHVVFETYSQLLTNLFSSILRVSCEAEILSIEECSYSEFNNSLPTPVILTVLAAPPMYGSLLMQVSPELAYMLITRLFGGAKTGENTKQFTEIELALVERLLRQQCRVFDEAWDKVIELHSDIERIETSPQFAQITAPNEPVAVVIISIAMGEDSGLMSLCLPHTAIEPIAQQLSTRMWFASSGRDDGRAEERQAALTNMLMNTATPLTAYFNPTPAPLSDIINLQIGDVIKLDHPLGAPLTVNINHIPKFLASVGTYSNRYALEIIEVMHNGDDEEAEEGDEAEEYDEYDEYGEYDEYAVGAEGEEEMFEAASNIS